MDLLVEIGSFDEIESRTTAGVKNLPIKRLARSVLLNADRLASGGNPLKFYAGSRGPEEAGGTNEAGAGRLYSGRG
jgi:hypothetical protein